MSPKTNDGLIDIKVDEVDTSNLIAVTAEIGTVTKNLLVKANPNPKITVSDLDDDELIVAVATADSAYFQDTVVGDGAIRASNNLFLGTLDSSKGVYIPGNLYLNNSLFRYSKGSWTPVLKYVRDNEVIDPQATITYDFQLGYYERMGINVSVFFDFQLTSVGGDAFVGGHKYVAIGGLPIRIGIASSPSVVKASAPLSVAEYPDGLGFDLLPAIYAPVYSSNWEITAYEQGFDADLFVNNIVSISDGVWTSDGYHLMVYATTSVYTAALTVPPWESVSCVTAPVCNFHITSDLVTYPGIRFSGTLTYMSDYE